MSSPLISSASSHRHKTAFSSSAGRKNNINSQKKVLLSSNSIHKTPFNDSLANSRKVMSRMTYCLLDVYDSELKIKHDTKNCVLTIDNPNSNQKDTLTGSGLDVFKGDCELLAKVLFKHMKENPQEFIGFQTIIFCDGSKDRYFKNHTFLAVSENKLTLPKQFSPELLDGFFILDPSFKSLTMPFYSSFSDYKIREADIKLPDQKATQNSKIFINNNEFIPIFIDKYGALWNIGLEDNVVKRTVKDTNTQEHKGHPIHEIQRLGSGGSLYYADPDVKDIFMGVNTKLYGTDFTNTRNLIFLNTNGPDF